MRYFQGNRMKRSNKFIENDITEKTIIKRALKTLGFHTQIDFLITFVEIQSDMTNHSKIFTAVIFSDAAFVFIKIHIKTPMQAVFDSPMHSDSFCKLCHIGKRRNKISIFYAFHSIYNSGTFHHSDCI